MDPVLPLGPQEFEQIRQLAYRTFGLDLKSGKEELVSARLRKLVRGGGFPSFQDYYRSVVEDRTGQSLLAMIDALATNHTSFSTRTRSLPIPARSSNPRAGYPGPHRSVERGRLHRRGGVDPGHNPPRSPAAAHGPHHRQRHFPQGFRLRPTHVYPVMRCHGVPAAWLSRYFAAEGRPPVSYQVTPFLRANVVFRRLNLIESYSWPHPFPIIFCRNVMIYFDRQTQQRAIAGLSRHLAPGGYLFVEHAESLTHLSHSLEYVRPAVYRKPGK